MDPTPITELVQFDLAGNGFFVLPGVIINVFARYASQSGQLFFQLRFRHSLYYIS